MSKEEEEAESRGFKVADRRRFVDHEDAPDEPATDPVEAVASETAAPTSPPPNASPASAPTSSPDSAAGAPVPGSEPGDVHAAEAGDASAAEAGDADPAGDGLFPEMTFSTFVISLMTQALMHLGEMAEEGHQPERDLPAAKQMIDLLGILREKTTGNLDANEEQLLGQMLYDLRMRYVEVSRGS